MRTPLCLLLFLCFFFSLNCCENTDSYQDIIIPSLANGFYTMFHDSKLTVHGYFQEQTLTQLGVLMKWTWFLFDRNHGMDFELLEDENTFEYSWILNTTTSTLSIHFPIRIRIQYANHSIHLQSPFSSLFQFVPQSDNFVSVLQPFSNMLSSKYWNRECSWILLQGPIFSATGFAQVHRQVFFHLNYLTPFCIDLQLTDASSEMESESSVLYELIRMHLNALKQGENNREKERLYLWKFLSGWPPLLENPYQLHTLPLSLYTGLFLPWEFHALPLSWLQTILDPHSLIDTLLVPSPNVFHSFLQNGIPPHQLFLLPHGVPLKNFFFERKTIKPNTFTFLFIGGELPRKGVDLLLETFHSTFNVTENVILRIHSNYKEPFYNSTATTRLLLSDRIRFTNETIQHIENLYLDAHCYISLHRSEGFGLTLLEAMSFSLPLIVPSSHSTEFVSHENAWLMDSKRKECWMYPCGENRIFQWQTKLQPSWEPIQSKEQVMKAMRQAYEEQQMLMEKSEKSRMLAREWTWQKKMLQRLVCLMDKNGV